MSVQINNGKVSDEHNGLQAMIADLLQFKDTDRVTCVITYKVTKLTKDLETGDDYPVMRATHIEPILTDVGLEAVRFAQESAFQVRTGNEKLDLYPDSEDETVPTSEQYADMEAQSDVEWDQAVADGRAEPDDIDDAAGFDDEESGL